jgi:hypothetical protein
MAFAGAATGHTRHDVTCRTGAARPVVIGVVDAAVCAGVYLAHWRRGQRVWGGVVVAVVGLVARSARHDAPRTPDPMADGPTLVGAYLTGPGSQLSVCGALVAATHARHATSLGTQPVGSVDCVAGAGHLPAGTHGQCVALAQLGCAGVGAVAGRRPAAVCVAGLGRAGHRLCRGTGARHLAAHGRKPGTLSWVDGGACQATRSICCSAPA